MVLQLKSNYVQKYSSSIDKGIMPFYVNCIGFCIDGWPMKLDDKSNLFQVFTAAVYQVQFTMGNGHIFKDVGEYL